MNPFMCFPRRLAKGAVVAALAFSILAPGIAAADKPVPPPTVSFAIQVPAGNVPYLLGHATGTQNYTCQLPPSGLPTWTFVAPQANLYKNKNKNYKGKVIATHYAGPTWQATDGSTVVGSKLAATTPDASAIPWLLLQAVSTTSGPDGGDLLTPTTYVQRVNTTGGLAPTTGCDGTTVGAAANVPYTADYYFYQIADSD